MTSIGSLFGTEIALGQIRNPLAGPAEIISSLSAFFVGDQEFVSAVNAEGSRLALHPEGPIFDFSQRRPISELLDSVNSNRSSIAKSIFSDLAALPEDQRIQRILQINDIVGEIGGLPSENIIGKGMPTRWANLILQGLGLLIAPVGLLLGVAQIADGGASFFRDAQRLKALGSDVARSRRQIEMLASIRKVARLDERR